MKFNLLHLFFTFLGALVLLFIVGPLVSMFIATSPIEIVETVKDEEVQKSIWLTIGISMGATLFFATASIPFAYLLARKEFVFKKLVKSIIDLPIVIPHSAAGIAILGIISRDSMLGKAADSVGLNFVGHPIGIGLAMAFVSIPFLINAAHDGFKAVPIRLEQAALTLKASPARVFFTISLPLAWRNIVSGLIMMFARGMSEFGAVVIVAYHPMITPVLIYERFGAFGLKYARPVSVVFIIVCVVVFIGLRMLTSKKNQLRINKTV
ncbi:MAG: ABC transporter permease [Bacteroidales bacterium]|nr:ABC transporter permease [Bacteroidales bacterium]